MLLNNADNSYTLFYNRTISGLCIGQRYEFSAYLANVLRGIFTVDPNVRFEVRSAINSNILIAQIDTGPVNQTINMTWAKFGISFVTPNTSIMLLMTSNVHSGIGNDLAIDDIAFCVCSTNNSGICP
ncbi:hypothetical protein NGRA_3382 [Nosema granulosis]|uniref:Uncharacterized protein n=1 Tax=Nosema granulosis TaxID=83296 RepID=A0A9P6GVX2_9MICR|nr:hypothetical protein NGRA_3382 [Nosema granulosis]